MNHLNENLMYKTIKDAKKDGWVIWDGIYPTNKIYYINIQTREIKTRDELVEE